MFPIVSVISISLFSFSAVKGSVGSIKSKHTIVVCLHARLEIVLLFSFSAVKGSVDSIKSKHTIVVCLHARLEIVLSALKCTVPATANFTK